MKGYKSGFRRILVILLSAVLMAGNLGITAFADAYTSGPDSQDDSVDEELFASDIDAPVEEAGEIQLGNADVEASANGLTVELEEAATETSEVMLGDGPADQSAKGEGEGESQKPSPANEVSDSGGPNARESVQWTDSSEDGSADPRDGGATAPDEVVPQDETTADTETVEVVPIDAGDESLEQLSVEPVTVLFETIPDDAVVTVRTAEAEAQAIPAEEDGSFLLIPGEYTYTVEAEGYVSIENKPFTVTDDEQTMLISFEMEATEEEIPEPVAFE